MSAKQELSGTSRRSETAQQAEYEQAIYDAQHRDHGGFFHHHDNQSGTTETASTEQLDPEFQKMNVRSDDDDEHASQSSSSGGKRERMKGKVRNFYENVIKPAFPEAIQDIKIMSGLTSLEGKVKKELSDPTVFPEVAWTAEVRRGTGLCPQEQDFLAKRKARTRDAFAKYMGLKPDEVHPDDVPTISFGGSGGGFRAMLGCLGYMEEMKRVGLWDCLTYVSGVSGSCWSLAAYYTFGDTNVSKVIDHCKRRFSPYHPLSGEAIRTILSSPGGARTTLGPVIQKSRSGLQTVAMDLYSVFTTGWIFLQDDPVNHPGGTAHKEVAGYQTSWYRWTSASKYVNDGSEPMPIITAIRHERPWKDWKDKEHPFGEADHAEGEHADAPDAWFQWFEFTPYEVGCDEIAAWVPTWGFGRPFDQGKSTMQLPEQSLALLLGLATSAPAGPLTSYITTISRNLPPGFLGNSVHSLARGVSRLWGKRGTDEFQEHHPLHACNEHNFMYHYTQVEKGQGRPPGLENSPRIHLIDSGMDNNCPTYVLLHPERQADVIINMDASSDVQKDTFPERVDQIGCRRGVKFVKRHDVKAGEDAKDPNRFNGLYAQIYDGKPIERPEKVKDSYGRTVSNPPAPVYKRECTMIYMPLLPNERAVPDFDPSTAKFSGSYNLVWTPEQVETLIKVCVGNFEDGEATVKEALHEAWQRRKAEREGGAPTAPATIAEVAPAHAGAASTATPAPEASLPAHAGTASTTTSAPEASLPAHAETASTTTPASGSLRSAHTETPSTASSAPGVSVAAHDGKSTTLPAQIHDNFVSSIAGGKDEAAK